MITSPIIRKPIKSFYDDRLVFYAVLDPSKLKGTCAYLCDDLQFVNALRAATVDEDTIIVHIATTEEGFKQAILCPEYLGYLETDVYDVYPQLGVADVVETEDGLTTVPRLKGCW